MAAGVEQQIALAMANQTTRDRQFEHFAAIRTGEIDALADLQASAGQKMKLHVSSPSAIRLVCLRAVARRDAQ